MNFAMGSGPPLVPCGEGVARARVATDAVDVEAACCCGVEVVKKPALRRGGTHAGGPSHAGEAISCQGGTRTGEHRRKAPTPARPAAPERAGGGSRWSEEE